ncbi:uncharacterized protein [Alexandromys fortis]|uniref:uncharacterized protein n=1 Tax=Alexandromys fortis TaxID=100897 RepID=UPI0021527E29|nr:uncharacterized protein LOC126494045 [Microtus fortis]
MLPFADEEAAAVGAPLFTLSSRGQQHRQTSNQRVEGETQSIWLLQITASRKLLPTSISRTKARTQAGILQSVPSICQVSITCREPLKSGAGAREPAQKTPTGSGVQRSRIKRGEGREQKTQDRGRRHGLWDKQGNDNLQSECAYGIRGMKTRTSGMRTRASLSLAACNPDTTPEHAEGLLYKQPWRSPSERSPGKVFMEKVTAASGRTASLLSSTHRQI